MGHLEQLSFHLPVIATSSCFHDFFFSHSNMAHSSRQSHFSRERSRSRDDFMWQPHPSQRNNAFRDSWHEVPAPPRPRDVLIFVNLNGIPDHMSNIHDNIMHWTTCDALPLLGRQEENALFTYSVLITTQRLESFTVYNLLYMISQHIWNTWDRYLRPSSMDLRWQDETDDTFVLHEEDRIFDLLNEH